MKKLFILLGLLMFSILANSCKKNTYIVSFVVGDEVIYETELEEGEIIKYPRDPNIEGYDFIGWDNNIEFATEDIEIKAKFKIKEYSVIFFVDNIIFDTKKVKHGNIVIIDKIPKKEGYKFIGWDKKINKVTSNLEYNAIFEELSNYTVKFVVGDEVICEQELKIGMIPTFPEDPIIEGGSFIDWEVEKIDEELIIYRALFSDNCNSTLSYYSSFDNFYNDFEIIKDRLNYSLFVLDLSSLGIKEEYILPYDKDKDIVDSVLVYNTNIYELDKYSIQQTTCIKKHFSDEVLDRLELEVESDNDFLWITLRIDGETVYKLRLAVFSDEYTYLVKKLKDEFLENIYLFN